MLIKKKQPMWAESKYSKFFYSKVVFTKLYLDFPVPPTLNAQTLALPFLPARYSALSGLTAKRHTSPCH